MTTTRKRKGQRPDGYIQVSATVGRDKSGKAIRKYFFGRTRTEAEAKRDKFVAEQNSGLRIDAKTLKLRDWIEIWKTTYKVKTDDYAPYINRINKDLGDHLIGDIFELHLHDTLHTAYYRKSTSAAVKYRMIIKQIFSRAKSNRLILSDPSENLALPKETTAGSHRALERWEADLILNNWKEYRAGKWAMIMLLCGLRRGEMVALDWEDVDLEKRTLAVVSSAQLHGKDVIIKTGAKTLAGRRTLPICDPLHAMLSETPEADRTGPVCRKADGSRITLSAVLRGWATYCRVLTRIANGEKPLQQGRRADREKDAQKKEENPKEEKKPKVVFDCTPHDLRHTYATALYDAGVDIKSAQYYLGHANVTMTINLYTHLSAERENQARSALTDYLDKWLDRK